MATGEGFTAADRKNMLRINAQLVAQKWPGEFGSKRPHYKCENCGFVHPITYLFEIDHIKSIADGGGRNRISDESAEIFRSGDPAEQIAELYRVGQNMQVLCVECNQGKKERSWVPDGKGMAFTHHDDDLNPDHIYHGPPTVDYIDSKTPY